MRVKRRVTAACPFPSLVPAAVNRGVVQVLVLHAAGAREGEREGEVTHLVGAMTVGAEGDANAAGDCATNEPLVRTVAIGDLEGDAGAEEGLDEPILVHLGPDLLGGQSAQR